MKKAQAAMEFLMTYGWAILVVLAAVGTLAYFGVLEPTRFVPERCTLPYGFQCEISAQGSKVEVYIRNAQGSAIDNITFQSYGDCNSIATGPTVLANGESGIYTLNCTARQRVENNLYLNYTKGGLTHAERGTFLVNQE